MGRRVSIRVVDADGRTRDLVGILLNTTTVQRRDGELAEFDPAAITHWRLVAERQLRAGTGAPLTSRIKVLHEVLAAASGAPPGDTASATPSTEPDGWLMRGSISTKRFATSALPIGPPPMGLFSGGIDDACIHVTQFYSSRSLTPSIRIAMPLYAELDAHLHGAGWLIGAQSHVLVADAADLIEDEGDERNNGDVCVLATGAGKSGQKVTVRVDEVPAGTGRISFHGDWAVIHDVLVIPQMRRRGIGKGVLRALACLANDNGYRYLAAEVDDENLAGLAWMAHLEFRPHHRYRLRVCAD